MALMGKLVEPCTVGGKLIVPGTKVIAGAGGGAPAPVPDSGTDCGLAGALSATLSCA